MSGCWEGGLGKGVDVSLASCPCLLPKHILTCLIVNMDNLHWGARETFPQAMLFKFEERQSFLSEERLSKFTIEIAYGWIRFVNVERLSYKRKFRVVRTQFV